MLKKLLKNYFIAYTKNMVRLYKSHLQISFPSVKKSRVLYVFVNVTINIVINDNSKLELFFSYFCLLIRDRVVSDDVDFTQTGRNFQVVSCLQLQNF